MRKLFILSWIAQGFECSTVILWLCTFSVCLICRVKSTITRLQHPVLLTVTVRNVISPNLQNEVKMWFCLSGFRSSHKCIYTLLIFTKPCCPLLATISLVQLIYYTVSVLSSLCEVCVYNIAINSNIRWWYDSYSFDLVPWQVIVTCSSIENKEKSET